MLNAHSTISHSHMIQDIRGMFSLSGEAEGRMETTWVSRWQTISMSLIVPPSPTYLLAVSHYHEK